MDAICMAKDYGAGSAQIVQALRSEMSNQSPRIANYKLVESKTPVFFAFIWLENVNLKWMRDELENKHGVSVTNLGGSLGSLTDMC